MVQGRSKDMDDINTVQEKSLLDEELLWGYWGDVSYIISEFNEYGGGSYEEEDEAYGWLDKISELAKAGNVSADAKFEFLDEAFKEYNIGNSGFEDALLDIFFELCETKEVGISGGKTWRTPDQLEKEADHEHSEKIPAR